MMTYDQKKQLAIDAIQRIRSDRAFPYPLRWFLFGLGAGVLLWPPTLQVLRACTYYLQ